jgi:3-phenylpropionate/trans-cinnamate dioxygenase ferredoxin reductase subunit
LQDSSFYRDNNIELMLGVEVTSIDPNEKTLGTKHGQQLSWDKLLLATGSDLQELDIPGSQLEGVFYLRRLSQAKAIKKYMENVEKAVIVGAGFIGSELASSLTRLGINVTIVEQASYPMEKVVGREVAEYFLNMHRSHGVEVITEDSVSEFHGDESLKEVVTENGRRLPCQMAIIGVGVTPNTRISHPQLRVEDEGYVVDEYGKTSLDDVYAAGDCTYWPYKGEYIHVEHWENAANQGTTVAKNLIQPQSQAFTFQPYFWSDQYDQNFEYLGHATEWSESVLRGSFEKSEFTMFYLDNEHVIKAAFIANQPDNGDAVGKLIEEQKPVDTEALANEKVSLEEVAKN